MKDKYEYTQGTGCSKHTIKHYEYAYWFLFVLTFSWWKAVMLTCHKAKHACVTTYIPTILISVTCCVLPWHESKNTAAGDDAVCWVSEQPGLSTWNDMWISCCNVTLSNSSWRKEKRMTTCPCHMHIPTYVSWSYVCIISMCSSHAQLNGMFCWVTTFLCKHCAIPAWCLHPWRSNTFYGVFRSFFLAVLLCAYRGEISIESCICIIVSFTRGSWFL